MQQNRSSSVASGFTTSRLPTVPAHQFRSLFCRRFDCSDAQYEERAFRKCLYWHAKFLFPLWRRLRLEFFVEDFNFIRYLGEATRMQEVRADAADFREANLARRNFWRTTLRIRVSGRKATRFAQQLFSDARRTNPPARGW